MDIGSEFEKLGVKYVQYQFTNYEGKMKGVEMPVTLAEKAFSEGIGVDGSSVNLAPTKASDIRLIPDPGMIYRLPWAPTVAGVICDVVHDDGEAFESDPRSVLKKTLQRLQQDGLSGHVRAEMEFYLLKEDSIAPTDSIGYMDLNAQDQFAPLRRKIADWMDEIGMRPKTIHHEVGPGQHEIEFLMQDPLIMADWVQIFKLMTGYAAQVFHVRATFMPKPFEGKAGNGLHVHQYLSRNNKSIFGSIDGFSEELYHYVAGLLKYSPEMTAVTNASINSYKRLVVGHEAPVYLTWGVGNRTAAIRIPGYEKNVRVEYRVPDPSGNIYYSLALMLSAGYQGIKDKLQPPEECTLNVSSLSEDELKEKGIKLLPRNLSEAISLLEQSSFVRSVVGDEYVDFHIARARRRWAEYLRSYPLETQQITDLEYQYTL